MLGYTAFVARISWMSKYVVVGLLKYILGYTPGADPARQKCGLGRGLENGSHLRGPGAGASGGKLGGQSPTYQAKELCVTSKFWCHRRPITHY